MVIFIRHFRPYLLGRRFTLRTDHSALKWLQTLKEPEGQLARWLEQLLEYEFEIIHGRVNDTRMPMLCLEDRLAASAAVMTVHKAIQSVQWGKSSSNH